MKLLILVTIPLPIIVNIQAIIIIASQGSMEGCGLENPTRPVKGKGVSDKPREKKDRIYDYDVYNDLGDPENDPDLAHPVLGNKDYPHPRHCKTSRPPTKSDPLSESRSNDVYVPKDESFSEVKNLTFNVKTVYSVLKAVIPSLETTMIDKNLGFSYFTDIDSLFNEGVNLPPIESDGFLNKSTKAMTPSKYVLSGVAEKSP
ncbi:hypothetical protein L1987_15633 [Smallanthus sonchifolius]|uniref:Uncharacterized protein n=1 Tax=Smallanthus sonchifolius TaxID=185202 RepID=A0ACB9J612_9ASTR|nr:hypothetical protein L1987_15633 [Smallanthus sonchifolius]